MKLMQTSSLGQLSFPLQPRLPLHTPELQTWLAVVVVVVLLVEVVGEVVAVVIVVIVDEDIEGVFRFPLIQSSI